MANLLNKDVQRIFKERPSKREIEIGIRHQDRLKFHTETVIDKDQLSQYYTMFITWISSTKPELLPKDKVERFKQLITVPLPTIELTESIFSHLYNVFNGQDAFSRYIFKNPKLEEDWADFNNTSFWHTHGFEAMINAIDSVWVLDLPREQITTLPEPKDRLINITNVVDIECDANNNCEHIIFQAGDMVYEYDSVFMRAYTYKEKELSKLPEFEMQHGLGYTPARMFWSENLMRGNFINKKSPLTNVLGDLDWLLTCHIFKKYMEIANSYPILAAYRMQQDYQGSKQEENRGRPEEDKRPAGADLIGAGSFLEVDPPMPGQPGVDAMNNPVKYINPDVDTLRYHVDNITDKRDAIFYSVVGLGGEATKEAINEKQVLASFESQTSILMRIANNFRIIQEFADKCKADIRYGKDELIEISIDYGTKFFLKSAADLIEDLNTAKQNGSHSTIVSSIMDEINEAKYRNDRAGMTRAEIIQELDPLPDKTFDEAVTIYDKGGITKPQFIIKANLLAFAKRFEREQIALTEYAALRPYSVKIALIYEEFLKYAQEIIDKEVKKQEPIVPNKTTIPMQ